MFSAKFLTSSNPFQAAWSLAFDGMLLFGVPIVAFEVGQAKRGEKASTLIGGGAGMLTGGLMTAGVMAGISLAIPGIGTGLAAAALASVIAAAPAEYLEQSMVRAVRGFGNLSRNIRRLEMGGDYMDSDIAQYSRISAIQEMNSALIMPRRMLGQEARLLHR